MRDPVDHIARGDLPWRPATLTECGRPLNDVAQLTTRDEAVRRWKDQGAKRAAFSLCMTCVETAGRHPRWQDDPIAGLHRELDGGARWISRDPERAAARRLLEHELRALAMLVEAHRDEFDAALAGLAETTTLADQRAKRGPERFRKYQG